MPRLSSAAHRASLRGVIRSQQLPEPSLYHLISPGMRYFSPKPAFLQANNTLEASSESRSHSSASRRSDSPTRQQEGSAGAARSGSRAQDWGDAHSPGGGDDGQGAGQGQRQRNGQRVRLAHGQRAAPTPAQGNEHSQGQQGHGMMAYSSRSAGAPGGLKIIRKDTYDGADGAGDEPGEEATVETGPDGFVRTFDRGLRVGPMPEPEWNPYRLVRPLTSEAPSPNRA